MSDENNTNGSITELQPLTFSSSSRGGDDEDESSLTVQSSTKTSSKKIFFLRAFLLALLIAGIEVLLDDYYESEDETVEDVKYKETTQQQHDASIYSNASSKGVASNHSNKKSWSLARWKPIGNECASPYQRLANTTILHCGIASNGKMKIDSVIENKPGTCGGVMLEPNYCLMPSRGEWIWEEDEEEQQLNNETMSSSLPRRFGSYHYYNNTTEIEKEDAASTSSLLLPRCNRQQDIFDGSQQGVTYDREWVPNSCSLVPLNPFSWTTDNSQCRTTIIMIGDSHIRNLFTATVHGLRGSYAFAEAHAGSDDKDTGIILTYEWRKHHHHDDNTTIRASDHFAVHVNTNHNTNYTSLFEDCSCNNNENTVRCLRIAFIWAPHFDDQVKHVQLVNDLQTDLVIVEPGNSYETKEVLSNEWKAAMEQILEHQQDRHLAILHFPYGRQPKERPETIEAWLSTIDNNSTISSSNRISYWQQGKFGFGRIQSRKTWHYACGLGRIQVRNDVIMSIEPCTDEADTAYIRAITTLHFDAFS
jgi:hypothetical protein